MTVVPDDFAELYAHAWPRLLRTTYAVTGDRQLAEDAVQSAFAKAFASWSRIRRADDPVAYLRRMAINDALAHRRRASSRRERPVEVLPDGAVPADRRSDPRRLRRNGGDGRARREQRVVLARLTWHA